jgi:hypothetical protein
MEGLVTNSWNPERRCTATNREGERCQRQPIPGGTVCVMHGGRAPQTIAAAKQRLLEGVEPAIARLLRFIETPPGLCDACGRCDDTGAIVSAIRTLLDRAGLGPHATMEVTGPSAEQARAIEALEAMSEDELIEHTKASIDRAQRVLDGMISSREHRYLSEAVEEGFIVPDDDEPAPIQEPDVQFPTGNVTPDESKEPK